MFQVSIIIKITDTKVYGATFLVLVKYVCVFSGRFVVRDLRNEEGRGSFL